MSSSFDEITKLTLLKDNLEKDLFAVELESKALADANDAISTNVEEMEQALVIKQDHIMDLRIQYCQNFYKFYDEYGVSSKFWQETLSEISDPNFHTLKKLRENSAKECEILLKDISNLQADEKKINCDIKIIEENIKKIEKDISEAMAIHTKLMIEPCTSEYNSVQAEIEEEKEKCQQLQRRIKEKEAQKWSNQQQQFTMFKVREKTTIIFKSSK